MSCALVAARYPPTRILCRKTTFHRGSLPTGWQINFRSTMQIDFITCEIRIDGSSSGHARPTRPPSPISTTLPMVVVAQILVRSFALGHVRSFVFSSPLYIKNQWGAKSRNPAEKRSLTENWLRIFQSDNRNSLIDVSKEIPHKWNISVIAAFPWMILTFLPL